MSYSDFRLANTNSSENTSHRPGSQVAYASACVVRVPNGDVFSVLIRHRLMLHHPSLPNQSVDHEFLFLGPPLSYLGHGTGREFLKGHDIQRLDCRAASLLMGCSSGKLQVRACAQVNLRAWLLSSYGCEVSTGFAHCMPPRVVITASCLVTE